MPFDFFFYFQQLYFQMYFTTYLNWFFYSANYNLAECTYIWGEFCGKIMSNLNTFLSIKYQNNSCYAVCIFCKKKYYYNKTKNEILSKQTVLCKNICGPWPGSCKSELLLKYEIFQLTFGKNWPRVFLYFCTHIISH